VAHQYRLAVGAGMVDAGMVDASAQEQFGLFSFRHDGDRCPYINFHTYIATMSTVITHPL